MWHICIHIKCSMYIHTLQEDMVGVVAFHAQLPIHFVHWVLGMEPSASKMLGKTPVTETSHPQPF